MINTHRNLLNHWLLNIFLCSSVTSITQADIAINHVADVEKSPAAGVDGTTPDRAGVRESIRQYELKILELEEKGGAYDENLGEELTSLGIAYGNLGRFEKAREALTRSLHITRVNHGPESPKLLPIMNLIIDINTAAGNRDTLDENYHYLYWLGRRAYGENSPELLDMIARITQGRLMYLDMSDPLTFKHLITSHKLCHDAIDIIDSNYGTDDLRLVHAITCTQKTNAQINSYLWGLSSLDERMGAMALIDHSIDYHEIKEGYYRIAEVFIANKSLPVDDRVNGLLYVADWCLFNKRRHKGFEYYNLANRILMESKDESVRNEELFKLPSFLSSVRFMPLPMDKFDDVNLNDDFIKISFNVTMNGRTNNIRIIENKGVSYPRLKTRAMNYVRWSIFRPRIQDGKPVATGKLEITIPAKLLITGKSGKVLINTPFEGSASS